MVSFVLSKSASAIAAPPAGPMSLSLSSSVFISLWLDARASAMAAAPSEPIELPFMKSILSFAASDLASAEPSERAPSAVIPLSSSERNCSDLAAPTTSANDIIAAALSTVLSASSEVSGVDDAATPSAIPRITSSPMPACAPQTWIDSSRSDREMKFDSQPLVSSVNGTVSL